MRRQDLTVSDTGYFVYCNGQDAEAFDGRIEFAVKLLPYTGSDDWIEDVLSLLPSDEIPNKPPGCEFCGYAVARAETEHLDIA